MEQNEEIIKLLKNLIDEQKKTNENLEDLLNLFKKYEVDEVLYTESLREG